MANIVITSTATRIEADFGALSTTIGYKKGTWALHRITNIVLNDTQTQVTILVPEDKKWFVSFDGNSTDGATLQIDSVNGSAPSSNSDLYDKLKVLI